MPFCPTCGYIDTHQPVKCSDPFHQAWPPPPADVSASSEAELEAGRFDVNDPGFAQRQVDEAVKFAHELWQLAQPLASGPLDGAPDPHWKEKAFDMFVKGFEVHTPALFITLGIAQGAVWARQK